MNRARLILNRRRSTVLAVVGAGIVAVQAIVIAHRRLTQLGDFDVSREFGRRFLAGEPLYAGGLHYPYMPTAALYFAPLAWLPPGLGLALRYGLALVCLWVTLRLLHTMVRARRPAVAGERATLGALTLLFAAPYVLRDLDDGGPHLILLAMLVGGIFAVWRGRRGAGAVWFGLAAALKAPNMLFIAFFAWKRQWRLAGLTALALTAWTVLPIVRMGPTEWWHHQTAWLRTAVASMSGQPSAGARDSEERPQNQALRPTLERYCRTGVAPAGPATDCYAPIIASAAVLALFAWWSRPGSAGGPPAVPDAGAAATLDSAADRWLSEASTVLILSVLLAPVAWGQHLVVLIPALYLIAATHRATSLSPGATAAMLVYFVLVVLLNREVIGRERSVFLLAHGVHTACMLIVLGVLMSQSKRPGR